MGTKTVTDDRLRTTGSQIDTTICALAARLRVAGREETNMDRNDAESTESAALVAAGPVRRRLLSGWRFARHLLEMVAAMMLGMAALGVALAVLGEPPGYASLLVEYGLMGAAMSAPMVAWMRYRGHSWSDGGEMTAAMLVPTFALVLPFEMGVPVPGLSEGSLMVLSHVAMIGGMVALMAYRFDRYAHGTHEHGARQGHEKATS